jgi:hypothetical protein
LEVNNINVLTLIDREKAYQIISSWMSDTPIIILQDYIQVHKPPIHPRELVTTFGKMCNTDIVAWFEKIGGQKYPAVALFMRSVLAKMSNTGYQERVFNSASGAMNSKQGKMGFEH